MEQEVPVNANPVQLPPESVSPSPSTPKSGNHSIIRTIMSFLTILLLIGLAGTAGYFYYQNQQLKKEQNTEKSLPPLESPAPSTLPNLWSTSSFGGVFYYDYPTGWHVGELWGLPTEREILLAMDPKPIRTAPRGGPLATFEIRILNGLNNPSERFEQERAKFNTETYTNITTETLQSELGPIYYYKGNIAGEYGHGQEVESYFLTFDASVNDPMNQQIIIASRVLGDENAELSAMLRHIVLSINQGNK